MRRPARARWDIPDEVKNETLYQLVRLLTAPRTSPRLRLGAAKVIALLDRIDQADERLAFDRQRAREAPFSLSTIIRDMQAAASEHERRNGDPPDRNGLAGADDPPPAGDPGGRDPRPG
jgi:hypothetical protein